MLKFLKRLFCIKQNPAIGECTLHPHHNGGPTMLRIVEAECPQVAINLSGIKLGQIYQLETITAYQRQDKKTLWDVVATFKELSGASH